MTKGRSSPPARAAAVLLAALVATGAHAEEWFDAYQLGLEALRQGKATRAADLFERAIKLRPEPGANLIMYGTNRLDRYHPYLRLAEAYLRAGQPERARDALSRSQARGKEPAAERARLAAQVEDALARARVAAAAPPTTLPAPPPSLVPALPPAATPEPAIVAQPTPAASAGSTATSAASAQRRESRGTPAPAASAPVAAPAPVASDVPSDMPRLGSMLIISEPGGASVYVDDEALGATDRQTGRLVKTGVAVGVHRVRLSRSGYEDSVQEAHVAEGVLATVRAAMVPAPRSMQGVASAAAVALALLAAGAWAWRRRAAGAPVDGRTVTLSGQRGPNSDRERTLPTAVRARTPAGGPAAIPETTALPAASRRAAEAFGAYELLDVLGKGGMATVFRARRGGETFALKRPLAAYLDDPEFLERFLREAEIGRTLHHPNIIRIHERGDVDGVPYFTMELIEGETLAAAVRRDGAVVPRAAARIVAQVAEALDYAHLKGVVHRDLKPSNIMVLADGTVKVMDYGIARARRFEGLTLTGAFLGTPDYVAPETAEGKGTDARSDLYSLGVVFYEIVTGKKPFLGDTPFATLRKVCTEPPTPPSSLSPSLPREVEVIILRLLRKDPDERYPGAEELLIELRDYLNRAS